MNFDSPMSDAADQPSTAKAESAGRNLCCPGSASVNDVLFDQLQYLVAHAEGNCPTGCPDCRRLQQVSDWLLRPFRNGRL